MGHAGRAREGQDKKVVLGHALWQRAFGGEPMLGRTGGDPEALTAPVRRALAAVDLDQPAARALRAE